MTNFIVILMFVGIIIKQLSYIRMLKIPTKKSILERLLIILGIFGLNIVARALIQNDLNKYAYDS